MADGHCILFRGVTAPADSVGAVRNDDASVPTPDSANHMTALVSQLRTLNEAVVTRQLSPELAAAVGDQVRTR